MGRKRKLDKAYKANVSLTKLELSRLQEMAATWALTPSQMVAQLINQVYESKAFLNGYDELSEQQRQALLERRRYLEEVQNRKRMSTHKRNYERRQGVDRGLTNVMVVLAPKRDPYSNKTGLNIPGVFCERLGQVWVIPYGLLGKVSAVEIMAYPCFASVTNFLADLPIHPSQIQNFIDSNKNYLIMSEGELNALHKLYEDNNTKFDDLPLSTIVSRQLQERDLNDIQIKNGQSPDYIAEILKEIAAGDSSRIDELPRFLRPSKNSLQAATLFNFPEDSISSIKERIITQKENALKLAAYDQQESGGATSDNLDQTASGAHGVETPYSEDASDKAYEQLKDLLYPETDRIDDLCAVHTDNQTNESDSKEESQILGPNLFKLSGLGLLDESVQRSSPRLDFASRVIPAAQQAAFSDSNSQLDDESAKREAVLNHTAFNLDDAIKHQQTSIRPSLDSPASDCSLHELERRRSRAEAIKQRLTMHFGESNSSDSAQNDMDEANRLLNLKPKPCYSKNAKTIVLNRHQTSTPKKRTSKKTSELDALISGAED